MKFIVPKNNMPVRIEPVVVKRDSVRITHSLVQMMTEEERDLAGNEIARSLRKLQQNWLARREVAMRAASTTSLFWRP